MKTLVCAIVCVLCVSCSAAVLEYQPLDAMPKNFSGVEIEASLSASPEAGTVVAALQVSNTAENAVLAAPYMFNLVSSDGMMNPPAAHSEDDDIIVKPGSSVRFTVSFLPVNNAAMHREYDMHGDLLQEYALSLCGLLSEDFTMLAEGEVLHFAAADDAFSAYIDQYGIEASMVRYTLALDADAFITKQRAYMVEKEFGHDDHHHDDHHHEHETCDDCAHGDGGDLTIVFAGGEFIVHEVVLRSGAFYGDGKLHVFIRIFNRGEAVEADAGKLIVAAPSGTYAPVNDFSEIEMRLAQTEADALPDSKAAVLRNERVTLHMVYAVEEAPQTFSLSAAGIVDNRDVPILHDNLHFTRE